MKGISRFLFYLSLILLFLLYGDSFVDYLIRYRYVILTGHKNPFLEETWIETDIAFLGLQCSEKNRNER